MAGPESGLAFFSWENSFFCRNVKKKGEIITDGFGGSGTTMVAAHQLNRKCYMVELDPKYCDVIVRRMLKLDETLTVKRNGIDCKTEFQ